MDCASCGRANRPRARFCGGCGKALPARCPACGNENEPDVQFCDACGASLASRPSDEAVARKVVTIVFADLIGSTALHERLDAESTRALMDRYYRALHGAVEAHGGKVVKLLGDGVMAAFGVPRVAEDDAIRAVRAAVGMQTAFRELALEHMGDAGKVGLRVAVNTGEVVVSEDQTDVVGDPVNVAARLQDAAREGDVLIGAPTQRLVSELVTLAPFGDLMLKGRSDAVVAYRVVSLDRPAGAPTIAFVGRDDELRRLTATYDTAVASGSARLAVILGSPGLGKSRLIAEFVRRLGGAATVLTARCDAAGGATFAPLAGALRTFLQLDAGASGDALRAAIEATVVGEESERARITDGIAALLAGTPASPEETFFVVRRLLAGFAGMQPVVLVIDDVQWAEPLLLDLTEHLVQWSTNVPLLLVVAARPELRDTRSALASRGGLVSEVVTLAGLDAGAATRLAANVIGAEELPAAIAGRVLATSEGNPLFLGELVRMLVHDGALKREGDRWVAGVELAALEMPPTIHALLAARIERLRPEDRTILERAAVVGRHFSRTALAQLLPPELRADLDARLESLRRSELIEPDAGWFLGEPALRFHHVLIRDAAYRRVLKGTRAELHARFADWLESRTANAVEHEETIGWHLEQAHQHLRELGSIDAHGRSIGERAAQYLAAAGRRALSRDDVPVAASLLGRALDRLDSTDEKRADLTLDWCEALLAAGEVEAAAHAIDELATLGHGSERLRAWHTCFTGQLAVLTDPKALHATADTVAAAAEQLASAGDAAGEAKAHWVHAQALGRLGKVGASEAALDRALAAARRARDRRRANAVLAGAPLAALSGPSPVTRASGRCLDVVRVLRITQGAPAVEAVALSCQAVLEALRGRTDAARRMIASSRHMVEELGITHRLLEVDVFAGLIELLENDAPAAERRLRTAYEGLRDHGLKIDAAQAAALLGRALLAQGRAAEAESLSHESEALAGDDLKAAIAWRGVRAEALAKRGEHKSAVEFARTAVELAAATDALLDHADARLALAAALRAAGRNAEADAEEARAIELWEAKGATLLAERARREGARDTPRVTRAERAPESRGAWPRPARRQVQTNAATTTVARIEEAFAARDGDELGRLYTDGTEYIDHTSHTTLGRQDLLNTWGSMLRVDGLSLRLDQLATLGESLALFRQSVSASGVARGKFDVGAYEAEHIVLVEVDAMEVQTRRETFAAERLGDAIARLYERYAEQLPDGPERTRAAATARSVAECAGVLRGRLSGLSDVDRYFAVVAPSLEFVDHRFAGAGSAHGAEHYFEWVRSLFEVADDITLRVDDVVGARSDALLVRWTNSGRQRAGGGAYERRLLMLWVFGADGLITHLEQFDAEDEDEALARFDALAAEPAASRIASAAPRPDDGAPAHVIHRRVPANAATANEALVSAALAARDVDAFPRLFAESGETVHHPTGVTYDRDGALTIWQSQLRVQGFEYRTQALATLGDSLALCRRSVSGSAIAGATFDVGAYENEEIIVVEVDAEARRRRIEVFAPDRLGDAVARLYERYAQLLPAGTARERAAATARSAAAMLHPFNPDRYATAFAPAIEAVDHRTLGTHSALGAEALAQGFQTWLDVADDIVVREDAILGLQPDACLVRRTFSGTARAGGGAFERQFISLWVFGTDGRIARIEFFEADHDDEALARFYELTAARAGEESVSPPSRDHVGTAARPAHRRVQPNAATANAGRLDVALAARDADALPNLLADGMEVIDNTTGATYERPGVLRSFASLLKAQDATYRQEPLATLGASLALCRQLVSASALASRTFDIGAYEKNSIHLIEVDAEGRRTRNEVFAAERLGNALTRLYERYAELLPDGPERDRATATARSVGGMEQGFDLDRFVTTFAPGVEYVDWRTVGVGSVRGREAVLHTMRTRIELSGEFSSHIDDILALRPDAFLVRWTNSGTVRVSGGAFETQLLVLATYGSDALLTRWEQFDVDHDAEALARFDELTAPAADSPATQFANAASRALKETERRWRERDWDAVVSCFAPTHVMDDRRALFRMQVAGEDFLANERLLFDLAASQWSSELLATRGERLALLRTHFTGETDDSGPMTVEVIDLIEVDADGRRVALVVFDLGDLRAAYEELDRRYVAGEGAPYAELLANQRVFRDASAARDWDTVARLLPDDFCLVSHRRLVGTSAPVGREEYLATRGSMDDLGLRGDLRLDHVLRISGKAALTAVTWYGTLDGGEFENPFVVVYTHDLRHPHRYELYDLDQLDAADARYEELATAAPGRIENSATRAIDRFMRAYAKRDWEGIVDDIAPGFRQDDRRAMMRLELDRSEYLSVLRLTFEMTSSAVTLEVIATRGDRLALFRATFTGTHRGFGPSEIEWLMVDEVDEAGQRIRMVVFDPDDLDAAYAELDERYGAGEVQSKGVTAAWARVRASGQVFVPRDWDAFAALFTPDLVVNDHRLFGWETLLGPEQWVPAIRSLVDLAPDVVARLEHVELSQRATLMVYTWQGTREGGSFELPKIAVTEADASGRVCRIDQYDRDQLDAALARYDELASARPESAPLAPTNASQSTPVGSQSASQDPLAAYVKPNAATAAADRLQAAFEARDWAAMRATCRADARIDDRRRHVLLSMDLDAWIASRKLVGDAPSMGYERQPVSTAGERVALERELWGGEGVGGPVEIEFLRLTEVDEDGLISATILFDIDARRAAGREAWTRWLANDAAAASVMRPILEMIVGFNDHDARRVRATLADDLVVHDRRRTGMGRIEGAEAYLKAASALWELAPDIEMYACTLACGPWGSAGVARNSGTLAGGGGAFETLLANLTVVEHGLITRLELFEIEDVDTALARFEELERHANSSDRAADASR